MKIILVTSSGKKDEKQEDNRLVFRREEDKFPSHFSDPSYPVPPIEPELPNVILEGDEKDNQAMETLYSKLQARRQEEEEKLDTNKLHIIVDKSNVVNQLLEMYREDDAVSTSKLIVSFEGEESSGEGLLRKPYSLFWESFISQNCDGSPFSRSEKEWVILGFCQQGRDRIGLRHVHPISIVSHQSSSYYALEHARKQDRTMVKAVPQRS